MHSYLIPAIQAFVQDKYIFVVGNDNKITVLVFDSSSISLIFLTQFLQPQIFIDCIYVEASLDYIYVGSQGQLTVLKFINKLTIEYLSATSNPYTQTTLSLQKADQFVYLSNFNQGLVIFSVEDIKKPLYLTSLMIIGIESYSSFIFRNEKVLYSNSNYYGVKVADISTLYSNPSQFINSDERNYLTYEITVGVVLNSFAITDDETKFFLGVRSMGIQVFDISTREKKLRPVFLQLVSTIGNFQSIIFLGQKSRYLVISTNNIIKIFQQTLSKQSEGLVDLFREDLSVNVMVEQTVDDSSTYFLINNQYLVMTGGLKYQFQVVDLTIPQSYRIILNSPFLLQEYVVNGSLKKSVLFQLRSRSYLIFANTQKIFVYDTAMRGSSPPSFDLVYTFKINYVFQINEISAPLDEDRLYMCYSKFIIILDIKNITDFKIVQVINQLQQYSNIHQSIAIDQENKFGVITVLQQAAIYFEINDKEEINYLKHFSVYGGEMVRYDKQNRGLFFIADGISGLTIIDCTDKNNPTIKSINLTNKWIVKIFQPRNIPNTLLLNEHQKGSVSVINFSKLDDIFEIQRFFEYEDETYRSIIDDYNKFMIVMQQGSLRVYFLEAEAPILRENQFISGRKQPELSQLDFLNQMDEAQIAEELKNGYAQIGEKAKINFSPLKLNRRYLFTNIKLYLNPYQSEGGIPDWINFNYQKSQLEIIPPKDLFTSQSYSLLFHLELSILFEKSDFLSSTSTLIITQENSEQIYNQLIQFGLLNEDGYLIKDFDPRKTFPEQLINQWKIQYGDDVEVHLRTFVRRKLIFSVLFFPFQVNIRRSLFLSPQLMQCQYDIEQQCYVQSLQQNVSIEIKILNDITFFMIQTFNGVLSEFQDDNRVLLLQGNPQQLNDILKQNIYIYSNQTTYLQQLQLTVSDKVDSDWIKLFYYEEIKFIWFKNNITSIISIQELYNKKYPNGLEVEQTFSLEINKQRIYTYHPTLTLSIKAYLDEKDEFEIPQTLKHDWIAFDGQILQAKSTIDQYQKDYTIYFVVTDGFETYKEQLVISYSIYSTQMILKITASISGLIAIILLTYFLRHYIHKIFFFRYYLHQTEVISRDNKDFTMRIQLMQNTWENAYKIFMLLKESFKENENARISDFDEDKQKGKYSTFYLYYQNQEGDLNESEFISDCIQIYKKFSQKFQNLDIKVFKEKYSKIRQALIYIYYKYALYCDQQSYYVYKKLKHDLMRKTDGINWYQELITDKKPVIQQTNRSTNDNLELSSSIPVNTMKSLEDTSESKLQFYDLQIGQEEFKKCISNLDLRNKDYFEIEYDYKIIQNAIKSDFYGYDYNFNLKDYRQSFGESLHINNKQIGNILCFKKEIGKNSNNKSFQRLQKMSYFRHLIDNLNIGFKRYPILLSKLDDLQDSDAIQYDIGFESITFKINIENLTSGQYKIQIYNTKKYLIFQYSFIIFQNTKIQNLQNKIKMFTFNTTNPNTLRQIKSNLNNLLRPPQISIYQQSLDSSRRNLNKDRDISVQSIIKNQNSGRNRTKNMITFDNESQYHFF